MDLATAPIATLAALIASRDVSPVEVVLAALERSEALDPLLHGWATLDAAAALAAASAAERDLARGRGRGPLQGIPIGVKENLAVAGLPHGAGSPARRGRIARADAAAVQALRAAGAVILGTTTMHEWAMGGTCSRMPGGPVRNPWDPARIPGGSSGGSAVATAVGMAAGALGTDGMGSIRTPAAWCGVVGLKPTRGLVSRRGQVPVTSAENDQVGVIARTVEDARLLARAVAGYDPADPQSRSAPASPTSAGVPVALRVGRARLPAEADAAPAVVALADRAAASLAAGGPPAVDIPLPRSADLGLVAPALASTASAALLPLAREGAAAFADQAIRLRVLAGALWRPIDVERAQVVLEAIRAEVLAALALVDVLVLPTVPTIPFPIGAEAWRLPDGTAVDLRAPGGQARITTRLTQPFNLAGVPAVSIPAGSLVDGMPVGIQLVGRPWEDGRLLDVAAMLEAAGASWQPPPVLDAHGDD